MTKSKKVKTKPAGETVVIHGSHSTRTEYPDGRVEFDIHWDKLERDVAAALGAKTPTKRRTKVKE